MKPIFKAILAGLSFGISANAVADTFEHDYFSKARSPYSSNLYLTNQISYDQTRFDKVTKSEGAEGKNNDSAQNDTKYQGQTFQASLGVEHFRFLQTGLNFAHSQLTLGSDKRASLQGQELGAHLKIILSSPVLNVALMGGPHLSQKTYINREETGVLQGAGYSGGVELVRFVSAKVSLFITASMTKEDLQKSSGSAGIEKVKSVSNRLGGGFSLWF
jgi:hypothetical protein